MGVARPEVSRSGENRIFVFRPLLSSIVGNVGPIALIAFAASALLPVLAIANVANLLLARGASQARDLAIRWRLAPAVEHLCDNCWRSPW